MTYKKEVNIKEYKRHSSLANYSCCYCGDVADSIDHVPPRAYQQFYPDSEYLLIRSCRECNTSLGAKALITIPTRASYLVGKYKIKYKKDLSMPKWVKSEIDELSKTLKAKVIKGLQQKKYMINRITHLQIISLGTVEDYNDS